MTHAVAQGSRRRARCGERRREFMHAILARPARARAHAAPRACSRPASRRIGAEQEMFLVDAQLGAGPRRRCQMLDKLADPHYTTELGQFQLEANADPQLLHRRRPLAACEKQLDELVAKARTAAARARHARRADGHPADDPQGATSGSTTWCRARATCALNKAMTELRGGAFEFSIKGTRRADRRARLGDARGVQLELPGPPPGRRRPSSRASTTSRRCSPAPMLAIVGELAARCSAAGCGPRRASRCSARRSTPAATRTTCARPRRASASARAGSRSRSSRSTRRTSRGSARSSAPTSTRIRWRSSTRGEIPLLKALRLHNGTIYRWNRACYGITDGKAHLRIENRVMPAGPERARRGRERRVLVRPDGRARRARGGHHPPHRLRSGRRELLHRGARGPRRALHVARRRGHLGARSSCSTAAAARRGRPAPPGHQRRRHQALPRRGRRARAHRADRLALAAVVVERAQGQGHAGRALERAGRRDGAAPADRPAGVGVGARAARRGRGVARTTTCGSSST